jgi:hypothetical protein
MRRADAHRQWKSGGPGHVTYRCEPVAPGAVIAELFREKETKDAGGTATEGLDQVDDLQAA